MSDRIADVFVAALTGLLLSAAAAIPALAQNPGGIIKDCADCPEMIVIPAGSFMMGSKSVPSVKFEAPGDEQPQHQVTLKSFAMGKYEVTQALWFFVMGGNPSTNKGLTLPVENVSWDDIQVFIEKLNAKTGRRYRLPTEAEWEYAARAGSSTLYAFGDDESQLSQYAWFGVNSGGKTHVVGQKLGNVFGLYDMYGNVWEWVQDCHKEDYRRAPTDGSAYERQDSCVRVLRGGSWYFPPWHLRSGYRSAYLSRLRYYDVGFRLAASLP